MMHDNSRLCGYTKDFTQDFVLTISHWLSAKLLSFTINLEDEIKVIGVPTHRIYWENGKETVIGRW